MKKNLKGLFVIAFDTLCDGNQCVNDDKGKPILYSSREEAIKEIFDDAYSMLSGKTTMDLKEFGISKKKLKEMKAILDSNDAKIMEDFLDKNPEMNDNNEFVERADEFLLGRKAFFTGDGVVIEGKKL